MSSPELEKSLGEEQEDKRTKKQKKESTVRKTKDPMLDTKIVMLIRNMIASDQFNQLQQIQRFLGLTSKIIKRKL